MTRTIRALALSVLLTGLGALPALAAEITIIDATPEQRAVIEDVLSWPELPEPNQNVVISFNDLAPGTLGEATHGTIRLRKSLTGHDLKHVLLHEYGHVWDFQYLTFTDRLMLMRCSDGQCDTPAPFGDNWRNRRAPHFDRPQEQFAWSFAYTIIAKHEDRPAIGPNPVYGGYMHLHMTSRFLAYRSWCRQEICVPN